MAADPAVDLLGEPRLKNSLTYYPGVQTAKGSVILGNVVRLQLQAEGAQPYIGYGFLKGLWLWRDQPYIRVQYMAPSRTDLPKDAIAYRHEPDPSAMPELMVTNRVGDLHLNALLGPVFIEGGPLLSQLFQENIGPEADGFVCARHLDPAVQRVQPLDEAFRLTPIVQAFPKSVLRSIVSGGAPAEEGVPMSGIRVPACAAAPACAPSTAPNAAAAPAGASSQPVPPAASAAEAAAGPRAADASGSTASGSAEARVPPAEPASLPPAAMAVPQERNAGAGSAPLPPAAFFQPGAMQPSAATVGADNYAINPSPGLGPKSSRSAILLEATYRGTLFRPVVVVRCPPEARVLREKVATVFGLVASKVRVVFQAAPGEWAELSDCNQLLQALERQPALKALPVHVSGEQHLHLPTLHVLASVISIANLLGLCVFAYFNVYLPQLPMPWIGLAYLPQVLLLYNGYAAMTTMSEEYVANQPLRAALSRKDGWLVTMLLVALLGPDPFILLCRLRLPPLGATLSKTAEQQLVFWGAGLHFMQDAPVLACNLMLHSRLGARWDVMSRVLLALSAASLSFNLIWHLVRMISIKPDDDTPELSRSLTSTGLTPVRRTKTLRKIDTAKYVGLNPGIIGNMASMYEA